MSGSSCSLKRALEDDDYNDNDDYDDDDDEDDVKVYVWARVPEVWLPCQS